MDKQSGSKTVPKNPDSLFRKICKNMKLVRRKSSVVSISSPPQVELPIYNDESLTLSSATEEEESFNDFQYEWQSRKMKTQDLELFVEQLSKFTQYIQSIKELTHMTYIYPHELQEKLEKNSNELKCFYGEARAALENIRRMQLQRKAVKKEVEVAKTMLTKIKDEEAREMESMLFAYDKDMYGRWKNLKITHKPELLESFKNDAKNRQKAMENLQLLIDRRLDTLSTLTTITDKAAGGATCSGADKTVGRHHRHVPAALTNAFMTPTTTLRPTSRRHRATDNTSSSGIVARMPPAMYGPVLPRFHMMQPPSTTPTAITLSGTSSTTLVSNGAARTSSVASAAAATTNNNNGTGFASEMQTVLHALFGELRHDNPAALSSMPPQPPVAFNSSSNSTLSDVDPMDIQLYMVD